MREPRRPRAASAIVKRSVLIAGHATSVSLEAAFWDGLKAAAADRGLSVAALVAEIDGMREGGNLSSALRVYVLGHRRGARDSTVSTVPHAGAGVVPRPA